jgi:hypothetical protein
LVGWSRTCLSVSVARPMTLLHGSVVRRRGLDGIPGTRS